MYLLEFPVSWIFLSADAQLLGTILAGVKMPLRYLKSLIKLNIVARLRLAEYHASGTVHTDIWSLLATNFKTD